MHNAQIVSRTPGSPSPNRLRQCIHNVTLRFTLSFQLSSTLRSSDSDLQISTDCKQFHQNDRLVHRGTQTTVTDEQSTSEVESELHRVKEQLRNAESSIAYLSDRVKTYRNRWLEEYHRADNLERYMPYGNHVPDLAQIPDGAPSPSFSPDFLAWDGMSGDSEKGEHI
ncbi:hypothetical protein M405DRAFT_847254 [Rhizopogon salebrosus TDB-379]|nr:hypothetical protein M405DRAFT_847254 [Rhizopogon salebrosus TDB-379]